MITIIEISQKTIPESSSYVPHFSFFVLVFVRLFLSYYEFSCRTKRQTGEQRDRDVESDTSMLTTAAIAYGRRMYFVYSSPELTVIWLPAKHQPSHHGWPVYTYESNAVR